MSLTTYREKRRFDKTPEPRGTGTRAGAALRFVVQKHQASHLHYDFRLELDGTLKSWAVPKGPSLDPADKRLAVMVEDHPLDYRSFEGTIPEGNYGAGTVMVWDEGTYATPETTSRKEAERDLRKGLEHGHVHFVLNGKKLHGEYSLVRLKRGKGNNWLLIKKRDEWASDKDVLTEDRSAASGRDLDEIAGGVKKRKRIRSPSKSPRVAKKSSAPLPRRVRPMLATLVNEPFDNDDWLFEVKWDGYRAIAEVVDGLVKLYSRNEKSFNEKFAPIVSSLQKLGHNAVLDGEVVVIDDEGKSQFQLLQNYQKTGVGRLCYYVFDLLHLDGRDLHGEPLSRRKELLAKVIEGLPDVLLSEHVEGQGKAFFKAASRRGLEGIIAKKADSPYREGVRGSDWLKIKTHSRQEAVICGFTEPRGSRKNLGALILGVYDGNELRYVGHTGGGFSADSLSDMRARLEPLVQRHCPFATEPATNAPAHWVRPRLVCEVKFQEWTEDGVMRQPIFLGLREDKSPTQVRREVPRALGPSKKVRAGKARAESMASAEKHVRTAARSKPKRATGEPNLTNLDKVYWPDEGYTKGDLIAYYREVAPVLLAYLRDRPLSLHRHPNGIAGKSFFQKDVSRQPPPNWVETVSLKPLSGKKALRYLLCQDEPSLLYIANLGCIELNPWNSRVGTLNNPDYLIIDLDPESVPFARVVEAALAVRKTLDRVGAAGYCKTSGKRGLHIFVPLGAQYDDDHARQFAELIANIVHRQLPEFTSLVRSPAQRQGRVYLDYLQNRRGQTLAAPYSVRPYPGATVSTPLQWGEVNKRLDPAKFTMKTMPRRLDRLGDLWKPVLGAGVDLESALDRLKSD